MMRSSRYVPFIENCHLFINHLLLILSSLCSFQQEIQAGTAVFYCINTTSHAAWGTLPALMHALFDLQLEVIDHRSWHTRFESTVINEVYVKGMVKKDASILDEMTKVQNAVKDALHQEVRSTSFSCLFNYLSEFRILNSSHFCENNL